MLDSATQHHHPAAAPVACLSLWWRAGASSGRQASLKLRTQQFPPPHVVHRRRAGVGQGPLWC